MVVIPSWTFGPDDGVPPPVAPFAHATAAGETLYVTGQMPTDLDGRLVAGAITEQTDQVMRNLCRVLELVGGGVHWAGEAGAGPAQDGAQVSPEGASRSGRARRRGRGRG